MSLIVVRDGRKVLGRVKVRDGKKVFVTRRRRDHINDDTSFAIDKRILLKLRLEGVDEIIIICETKEGERAFSSPLVYWFRFGKEIFDVTSGRSKVLCPVRIMHSLN